MSAPEASEVLESTATGELPNAADSASVFGEDSIKADSSRSWVFLGALILGYIGIYLCRKNLAVAVPVIQKTFGVNKEQTGTIASTATIAYMLGKLLFGPLIDKVGGRTSFLVALLGVAIFGGLGAMSGSLMLLTIFYTGNRFFGAAGWGSMVKQVPGWFSVKRLPVAMALLSMSYAVGGYCALYFAGMIAHWSGDDWRAVMGVPSIALIIILLVCWMVLPKNPPVREVQPDSLSPDTPWQKVVAVTKVPQFWIICGLSFVLTITRDFFNDWSVDFFKTAGGDGTTIQHAAELSTSFDLAGAVGILFLGTLLMKMKVHSRKWLLIGMLLAMGALIYWLPALASRPLWLASVVIGFIGFLSYGPYSLLAGIFSLEIKGRDHVATVAGFVDGSGYLAGVIAGRPFGRVLDKHGYQGGFHLLAFTSLLAVVLCLFLYKETKTMNLQPRGET